MTMRHGHLAPFLAVLVARSGLTGAAVADEAGLSPSRLSARLYRPEPLTLDKLLAVARVCGATPEEVARVRALDALDRGALPLPEGVDEVRVAAALAVLEAAS
jgi:transcriptional regulator with XRE-family HTH domain